MTRPGLDWIEILIEPKPFDSDSSSLNLLSQHSTWLKDIPPLYNFLSIVPDIAPEAIARLALAPKDDDGLQEGKCIF